MRLVVRERISMATMIAALMVLTFGYKADVGRWPIAVGIGLVAISLVFSPRRATHD